MGQVFLFRLVPRGDPAGIRTQDPYIKSVLLYQLSYGIKLFKNVSFFGKWCKDRIIACIVQNKFQIIFGC